jgi:hypothetical protein
MTEFGRVIEKGHHLPQQRIIDEEKRKGNSLAAAILGVLADVRVIIYGSEWFGKMWVWRLNMWRKG